MNRYAVNRPCEKCGAANASTEYIDQTNFMGQKWPKLMSRICPRCGYAWYELPLDAKDPVAEHDNKARHIESPDAHAICLCGENVVDNGSGLFVCPSTLPKEGAA